MGKTGGITDSERNPFTQDGWIEQGYGLTGKRRTDLEPLLGQTREEILKGDENLRRYPAYVGIRWGFAELQDDTLVPTEKWDNRHNYDKYGEPKTGGAASVSPRTSATSTRTSPASRPRAGSAPAVYSQDALVKALQPFQSGPVIERYVRNDLSGKSPNDIVSFTMGTSIYRAFRHESPSQRYRNWRWYGHGEGIVGSMKVIKSQEAHDRFVLELGNSLVADWGATNEDGEPSRMNIGIAMKIVNLLLKHMTFSGHSGNDNLVEFLHVPWDSFTLSPLCGIWRGDPPLPDVPGQGFVKNLETYYELHALITEICREAQVRRIMYEFWAWDAAHK